MKFFANIASTPSTPSTRSTALRTASIRRPASTIDTDLRWELLEGLVLARRGRAPEIDAALAADNTATGQQSAASARATRPGRARPSWRRSMSLVDERRAAERHRADVTLGSSERTTRAPAYLERYFATLATSGTPAATRSPSPRARALPVAARLPGARRRDAGLARRQRRHPGAAPPGDGEPRAVQRALAAQERDVRG